MGEMETQARSVAASIFDLLDDATEQGVPEAALLEVLADRIAAALREAHEAGRRAGIEQAARVARDDAESWARDWAVSPGYASHIESTIRALTEPRE